MKRLLYISLLAIAMLSLAAPVYAQEGYPVDKGYPVDEPTDEAIEKQSQGAAEAVADQSVDVPAGGEGPSDSVAITVVAIFVAFVMAWLVYQIGAGTERLKWLSRELLHIKKWDELWDNYYKNCSSANERSRFLFFADHVTDELFDERPK